MSKTVLNNSTSWFFFSILCLSILVSLGNSGKDGLDLLLTFNLFFLFPASVIVKRDVDEHTDSLGEAFSDKMENFHVMLA